MVLGGMWGDARPPPPAATQALPAQHPAKRSKCRQLFRSPSMPSSVIRPILKRIDRPQDRDTPVKTKRRRSVAGTPGEEAAVEPVGDGGRLWGEVPLLQSSPSPAGLPRAPALPVPSLTPGCGGVSLVCVSAESAAAALQVLLPGGDREPAGQRPPGAHRGLLQGRATGMLQAWGCCPNSPKAERGCQRSPAPVQEPKPSWRPLLGDKGDLGL